MLDYLNTPRCRAARISCQPYLYRRFGSSGSGVSTPRLRKLLGTDDKQIDTTQPHPTVIFSSSALSRRPRGRASANRLFYSLILVLVFIRT